MAVYAVIAAIGILPTILGWSVRWQALGLGLWYPGGGFADIGGWANLGFAVTLLLFTVGLLLWFLSGNMIAPMGIWVGTAIWAGLVAHEPAAPAAKYVVPALALVTILLRIGSESKNHRKQLARREQRNAYLPEALKRVDARSAPPEPIEGRELTTDQIAATRFLLDRALQPLSEFQGFDVIDQFQTAALRYQLSFSQFALALMQRHYTPRFHGYLSEAQRNLIDKMTNKKVWGYWVYESLWGNLSTDFDPASRDNIMLGGFYNVNVALYTINTGDDRYLKPGSVTFQLNAKTSYRHDARTLAKAAVDNFTYSSLCLYPCEPHLAYTFCNTVGFNGLFVNDRLFGTRTATQAYPEFRKAFEEDFMTLDGETQSGRMRPTGLVLPRFNGLFQEASIAWITTPFFPDIAKRSWALIREEAISFDESGDVQLKTRAADGLDTGNYRKSEISPLAHTYIAAREHGDYEMADKLLKRIDRVCERTIDGGVLFYPRVSHYFHAFMAFGRLIQKGDWSAMIKTDPVESASTGPVLAACAYPDVLVAKAYGTDTSLELVLFPGTEKTRQCLKLGRLDPGQRYGVSGDTTLNFVADQNGEAAIDVDLHDRTTLHIRSTIEEQA